MRSCGEIVGRLWGVWFESVLVRTRFSGGYVGG